MPSRTTLNTAGGEWKFYLFDALWRNTNCSNTRSNISILECVCFWWLQRSKLRDLQLCVVNFWVTLSLSLHTFSFIIFSCWKSLMIRKGCVLEILTLQSEIFSGFVVILVVVCSFQNLVFFWETEAKPCLVMHLIRGVTRHFMGNKGLFWNRQPTSLHRSARCYCPIISSHK